ncbi:MAG: putative toxin-antitoxin system toxin component, PIN family [Proteobacteria bacterium]|nr:putative toxin-antitoxin system toxin component, PIN family [Pseudomonadota bacterium]
MKVVIDTNILVSGLRSNKGASYVILEEIGYGAVKEIISIPLFLEYEEVLKRKENLDVFGLKSSDIDDILNMICAKFKHVIPYYLWRPFLKDPEDDMLLELAVCGKAEFIITHNIKDFKGTERFEKLAVITPQHYLTILKGRNHE